MDKNITSVANFIALVSILMCYHCSACMVVIDGQCPNVTAAANPSGTDIFAGGSNAGVWYEVLRCPSLCESNTKCATWTFSSTGGGNYTILKAGKNPIDGSPVTSTGSLTAITPLTTQFTSTFSTGVPSPSTMTVIGFSATNGWISLYSCTQVPRHHIQTAWILTNVPNPTLKVIKEASDSLIANAAMKINPCVMLAVDQNNC